MLKTRNLIFTLSLSPLLSFAWQLPNQAQSFSPSKGTAGVDAGAATGASQTSGFSTPTGTTQGTTTAGTPPIVAGVTITISSGVSTDGKLSVATTTGGDTDATVAVTAATVESTSSSITVTDGATANTVVITLAPQSQVVVNQLAAAIVQNLNSIITGGGTTGGGTVDGGTTGGGTADGGTAGGGTADGGTVSVDAADIAPLLTGGAGSQQAAVALTNSFTAAGISPQLATALVTSLTGLFASNTGSLPNQPVAMTTSGQLVASTKAFKPVTIIAQGSAGISVNINKLNDAIVAYNAIVLQSKPEAVKNLSNNTGFRGIGGILKELRTAVK
ncbi:MAG: hypothetical protein ACK45Z_13570 [Dolichospermum sp.]